MGQVAKGLAMSFDTRQIQTAVQGGPVSDEPLNCPTDPDELDAFLREHSDKSFWCGELLGGCGGQLTTKRCVTRVCHFAHLPDPLGLRRQCGHRARGASSADHLYVKTATRAWLHTQGHTPRYHFINREDTPIGALVDVELDDRRLRFHMNSQMPPDWDATDAGELILGPGVRIAPARLKQLRYVNRVKFETDGHRRVLVLGTEVFDKGTFWGFSLTDCEITEDGRLKTPVVERLWNTEGRRQVPGREAVAAPTARNPDAPTPTTTTATAQIGKLISSISNAKGCNDLPEVQRLCEEADSEMSRCEGVALYHLETAVGDARRWIAGHDREHRVWFGRLEQAVISGKGVTAATLLAQAAELSTHGTPQDERQTKTLAAARKLAVDFVPAPVRRPVPVPRPRPQMPQMADARVQEQRRKRRLGLAETRSLVGRLRVTGLPEEERCALLAELAPAAEAAGKSLSTRDRRDVQKWLEHAAEQEQASVPKRQEVGTDRPSKVVMSAASAVRGALKKAAREQRMTTWKQLEQQLGSALPNMSIADRVHVLICVDKTTPSDQALLSSLVVANDPHLTPHYREIAGAQNLEAPQDQDELRDVLDADVQQVFSTWSHQ